MAFISFEHRTNGTNKLKSRLMSIGSGGDYIHCEIVLNEFGNKICSSWWPTGVQIRDWRNRINPERWTNYDISSIDLHLYQYFKEIEGTPYTLPGLAFNMIGNMNLPSKRSFCSQVCYDAIAQQGQVSLPTHIGSSLSPADLEIIIQNSNFRQLDKWH